MRRTTILACIVATVGLCSCIGPPPKEIYTDDKVKVIERTRMYFPFTNPHATSDTTSMKVFGRTYKNVRGTNPFYLEIPDRDSILFVTGRSYDDGQATVHVLNLTTQNVVSFPAHDSHIGMNIGQKERAFEKIESVKGDKLVIRANYVDRKYTYYLDIKAGKFEREEGIEPDWVFKGRTNVYTWPAGKAPEY